MNRFRPSSLCRPSRLPVWLLLLTVLIASDGQARTLGNLDFQPCTLAPAFAATAIEAQCASLSVAENRAAPDGRQIDLAIAWLPARGEAEPDPVFMLAGGPGQAARDAFVASARALDEIRKRRHVILVDQRGTGGSHPLVCRDAEGRPAAFDEADPPSEAAMRSFAEQCRDALSEQADLRFYGTGEAIADLDTVRAALAAERINLIGVSYGTRVAQHYARRYPQHTRTVVLDGVVPNDLVLGAEHARNLEAALDMHFERCRSVPECLDRLGDPREHLDTLLAIEEGPDVEYRDPTSGELRRERFARGHLVGVARMFSYAPNTASTLPLTLSEAAAGRYEPLMAQARLIMGSLGEQIHHGMQLSVMCNEDADELVADPADENTVLGNELIGFSRSQCEVWPRGVRDPAFRQPLTGDTPVLLLSGELDPVTPPRYGDAVAKHLNQARHLVLKGQGHAIFATGCLPRLLAQFLDRPDPNALDAGCLDALRAPPPFVAFYGWEP